MGGMIVEGWRVGLEESNEVVGGCWVVSMCLNWCDCEEGEL
jgi:hypothetical protein